LNREMSFFILTLGCKINQYESHAIRERWISRGLEEVSSARDADLILINSCAVTENAISDVKKYARRFIRENPGATIVVTGCAIPRFEKEIASIEGISYCIPQAQKPALLRGPLPPEGEDQRFTGFEFKIHSYFRARPIIKIQDGCSHYCRYCIVPLTRGPSRSRKVEEILGEALSLVKNGYEELIVSGINLKEFSSYYHQEKVDLWRLLTLMEEYIEEKHGPRFRIRLSSLDPSMLDERALNYLTSSSHLAPHLHLSIQSASPVILESMGRAHYHPEEIKAFLYELSRTWKTFALGADILVGFPGEGEKEFSHTFSFCKHLPFTYGHVFTYSPRPNTPAATLKNQVSRREKRDRSMLLRGLFMEKKKKFISLISHKKALDVVVEDEDGGIGMCQYYLICKNIDGGFRGKKKGRLITAYPVEARDAHIMVKIE